MHTDPGRIKYTQRITRTQSRPAGGHARKSAPVYRTERRPTRTRQMSAAALAPPRRPLVKASHAGVLQRSAAPQQRGQLVGPVRAAHQVRQAHVHLDAAVLGAGSPSRAGEGSGPARRGCTCERERSRVGCDRPTTSPKGARRARTARRELAKLRGRKWAPCAHARTHAEASHRAARRLPSGTRPADQPTAAGVPRTADGGGRGVRRGRGTPAASSSEGAESSSLRSRR